MLGGKLLRGVSGWWPLCFPSVQLPQGYGDVAVCPTALPLGAVSLQSCLHSLPGRCRMRLPAPAGRTDLNGTDGCLNCCTLGADGLALLITCWIYPRTFPPNKLLSSHRAQMSLIPPLHVCLPLWLSQGAGMGCWQHTG